MKLFQVQSVLVIGSLLAGLTRVAVGQSKVLFTQSEQYAVYESIGVSSKGYVVAATWLNEPEIAEVFSVATGNRTIKSIGDTNPMDESSFFIDVAKEGTSAIVARGAPDFGEYFSVIYGFDVSTTDPNPEWNMTFDGLILDLAVSADGSTFAVSSQDLDATTRVRVFDGATQAEKMEYQHALPEGTSGALLSLSSDGTYVAVLHGNSVTNQIAIDVLRGSQRNRSNVTDGTVSNAPGQAFAISYDGKYIVAGQAFSLVAFQLASGSALAYSQIWSVSSSSFYVSGGCVAFSPDSYHVAVGWQNIDGEESLQPWVQMYNLPSSTPTLNYTFPMETGQYPNWPIMMDVSQGGKFAAFASWGAEGQQAGAQQLQVFRGNGGSSFSSAVAGQFFTPGSMFGTSIATQDSTGQVVACAAGKHVHATVMGNGGDLICVGVAS